MPASGFDTLSGYEDDPHECHSGPSAEGLSKGVRVVDAITSGNADGGGPKAAPAAGADEIVSLWFS